MSQLIQQAFANEGVPLYPPVLPHPVATFPALVVPIVSSIPTTTYFTPTISIAGKCGVCLGVQYTGASVGATVPATASVFPIIRQVGTDNTFTSSNPQTITIYSTDLNKAISSMLAYMFEDIPEGEYQVGYTISASGTTTNAGSFSAVGWACSLY